MLAGINADSGFPSLRHRSATSDGLRGGSDIFQHGCDATTCGKGPGMLTFPLPTPIRLASQPRASQGYALSRDRVQRRCLETAKLRPSELPLVWRLNLPDLITALYASRLLAQASSISTELHILQNAGQVRGCWALH